MKNILEYNGYFTKVEFSAEDKVLYGKIEGINDLVTFEGESVKEIETEFHKAVDDYLELCRELGQNPDKAYSGTFNVRIAPELHRKIAIKATKDGESLNAAVEKAIKTYTDDLHTEQSETRWGLMLIPENLYSLESSTITSAYPTTRPLNYNTGGSKYAQ